MNEGIVIAGRSGELYDLVEKLARVIISGQAEQESRFVRLATAILEIRTESLWRNWGFKSFGAYIDHVRCIVGKERSTLYGYLSATETLLPVIGKDKLEQLGINKALVLRAGMKQTGRTPSSDLIDKASDPKTTTESLKTAVNTEFKIYLPEQDGVYHEFGFYCDTDEWLEIEQAMSATKRAEAISNTVADSFALKLIVLAWAREYMSGPGVEHA